MPREVPRIDFRSSAWRRPHRLTNSLISCEPADTVESPCGPAHTKQGCLSIRVACAYPNAHGRASSTRAPFRPSRRSRAVRARTPFELVRRSNPHAMHATYKTHGFAWPGVRKKPLCLPFLVCIVCSACLACPACFACLTLHGYLACLACPARSACPACFACPAIPACLACGAFPALPACPA